MATVTIRPNADDYSNQVTKSTGTTFYGCVDETTLDIGDYITYGLFGGQAVFGWTSSGLSSETINKVTFYANLFCENNVRLYNRAGGVANYYAFLVEGSSNSWSLELTTNPETDASWAVSDLTNLSMGIYADDNDAKDNPILYQLYAVVDYEESAGGDDYTLTCAAGSYSLTGTNADLTVTRHYTLVCGAGSYALTGTATTFEVKRNYVLVCGAGSYALTGSIVDLTVQRNYVLACSAGAYTLTGSSVIFVIQRNYSLACEAGSYSLTGTDANLVLLRNYILACEAGSYALTGTNAGLTSARTMACNAGSYTLTGTNADFYRALVMACEAGSYALTGTDASLTSHRIFALGVGSYVLVGMNAGLYKYVQFPYAEVWDGKVVMSFGISKSVSLNKEINKIAVMNRELDFTYSELESTL